MANKQQDNKPIAYKYGAGKRAEVLLDYLSTENVEGTAKTHNIAPQTVKAWVKEAEETGDIRQHIFELQEMHLAAETYDIITNLVSRIKVSLKNPKDKTPEELEDPKIALTQLITSFGISVDKLKALNNSKDKKNSSPIAIQINFGVPRPGKGSKVIEVKQ